MFAIGADASGGSGGLFSGAICFEDKGINPNKVDSLHDLASASRIGWIMSGAAAAVASIISFFLIYKHAQYYTKPNQQRYIIRICLMIPIYAIVSWLSYFYYRQSVYYEVLRDCYEAFVIASFFILLLQYLGDSAEEQAAAVSAHWELKRFPFPFNCISYSPASTHFLWGIKYGILQYTILKPITTLISMVSHLLGIYCPESYSPFHVRLYVVIVGFMSVTVAMYALITFYMVVSDDLKPYKPFSKFLCVKLIIFFCFWQYVAISLLASFGLIHETEYWTQANIANGLNRLSYALR
ncbi:organic solute transporter subunit alpha/Transmembrane protein [Syncephalis plumigaleata]|nr:organic solute transporter subunit alpha/Transmembrane protein [Syncephalis plumigaleata]